MSTHHFSTYHRQKAATYHRNVQLRVERPRILESVQTKPAKFVELDERSVTTRDPRAHFVKRLALNVYGSRMTYPRKSRLQEFVFRWIWIMEYSRLSPLSPDPNWEDTFHPVDN